MRRWGFDRRSEQKSDHLLIPIRSGFMNGIGGNHSDKCALNRRFWNTWFVQFDDCYYQSQSTVLKVPAQTLTC